MEPPTLYVEEEQGQENGFSNFENTNLMPSNVDVSTLNLWTSKATACLINQYKKYRSMVGQSTQIRSLREMFEMISLEMQNYGFYFSPQKCENKWRVLERKYKNLMSRERLKKPGRMRDYGQWEHRRALDEIFNEKRKHMYLEENDSPSACGSAECSSVTSESGCERGSSRQQEDPLASLLTFNAATNGKDEQTPVQQRILTAVFEKFFEKMLKNFALAEENREKRHKEMMAVRQKELELKSKLVKLKEQKMELQRHQMIAAAHHLTLNTK